MIFLGDFVSGGGEDYLWFNDYFLINSLGGRILRFCVLCFKLQKLYENCKS